MEKGENERRGGVINESVHGWHYSLLLANPQLRPSSFLPVHNIAVNNDVGDIHINEAEQGEREARRAEARYINHRLS